MRSNDSQTQMEPRQAKPIRFLFVRVFWVALGPAFLLAVLASIVQSGTGWVTMRAAVYFAVLALMIGLRRYDFLHGDRTNLSGEETTEAEVRRYSWMWGLGGAAAWGVANLLGNHILNS
jgi:hypothetical protein